jgi:hypothetical protein
MALTSWVSELFTVHAESATTVAETPSNTESVSSKPDEAADDDEAEEGMLYHYGELDRHHSVLLQTYEHEYLWMRVQLDTLPHRLFYCSS